MSNRILIIVVAMLLVLVAGVLLSLEGQQKKAPVRVGVVSLTDVDYQTFAGFRQGMTEFGYVEGENIVYINAGAAGAIERLEPLIYTLLQQDVDLIYVSSTPATIKVKEMMADHPVPVIFAPVNDPVGAGIVASLKHPGGMITGIKLPEGDTLRLRWLRDFAPQARRIFFPYNPVDKSALESLRQIEEVLPLLQMELVKAPMWNPAEIIEGVEQAPDAIDAIFLPRDSSIESQIKAFVELSYQRRIPLSAPSLSQVELGALYTFGFVHFEFGRQSARLADQILHGISPADIPVEQAESYLAINLATAEKIGFYFSDEVLRRADFIIRETVR